MKLFVVALAIIGYLGKCQGSAMVSPEALNVTLAVFSGVPDPQWLVTPNAFNYQKIKQLYGTAKTSRATYLLEQMPAKLGYKGFLIRENGQDQATLILGPATKELQEQLLKSIPVGKGLPESLQNQVAVVIKSGKVLPVDPKDLKERVVKRAAPNYEGASVIWNTNYARPRNNCYNYGNDKATNTFAQPGRGSGLVYGGITNDEIKEASRRDGLVKVDAGADIPNISPTGPWHLVALVVDPGVDFHWYRLDSNGNWSHKPGQTRITNTDGAGNLINDPRLAANALGGPNYAFVCFMKTNKNTVNIR
ncbi:uncharacterized protein LOC116303760 [Actinia tenebrosa]|uniref:Uncharacterized protein LOC116303760 n=1 Tax=Actinia tenebrosa TaxID=6105 RepID=A0A6P8IQ69_ACTTE|nr:uncharacterized protein LOC116303760 [Actinia tenebrosa]